MILKRFDQPDEIRELDKGKFELIHLGDMTIGRATYQPGWQWSADVGKALGEQRAVEHLGMVISGCATASIEGQKPVEMRAEDLFYVSSSPHDSWVVGDEPYVSLHFLEPVNMPARLEHGVVIRHSRPMMRCLSTSWIDE